MGFGGFILFCAIGFIVTQLLFSRLRTLEENFEKSLGELKNKVRELERQLQKGGGANPDPAEQMPRSFKKEAAPSPVQMSPPPAPKEEKEAGPVVSEPVPLPWAAAKAPAILEPSEPDPFTRAFGKVKDYFTTGNTLVKVGVVLIFFGFSFLLKFAIDNNMLPIELRLTAAALFALALVRIGWNLRDKSREYGLVLQGGGIGLLMLTTFVSLKSYGLIHPTIAFALLISFTIATAVLAVKQDSLNLAAFGLVGGFLAPILASTGQGQHVVLFCYYALLNLGIVFISWEKAWRELNLLGFVFTFAISTAWGVLKYNPELYATTQPFLILFFLMYIAIPLIFANKKEPELRGYVDGTIVFGNSVITMMLQLQLVKNIPYGGAFSALAFAAFYIFLSRYLLKHKKENYRLLSEAFISIGIVFVTLAIPLAFDGLKTSAVWALEAAGMYWVSVHQNRRQARYFSTLLLFATSVSFFLGPARGSSDLIFLNTFFLSCLFMAVGAYCVSYISGENRSKLSNIEAWVPELSFTMGSVWWIYGGLFEIDRFTFPWWSSFEGNALSVIPRELLPSAQLLYLSGGALVMLLVGRSLPWRMASLLALSFVFVLFAAFLRSLARVDHPFASYGYVAWLFAFAVYVFVLHSVESNADRIGQKINQQGFLFRIGHAGLLWVLTAVLVCESRWLGRTFVGENRAWGVAAMAVAPTALLWVITRMPQLFPWPVQKHRQLYMGLGAGPVALVGLFWLFLTNWTEGGAATPLPYVPFLNPLELSQLALLFVTTLWALQLLRDHPETQAERRMPLGILLGGLTFLWLNGVLCRAIHHFAGVPFSFDSLFDSVIVQVSLSLFWTLLGIAVMLFASKRHFRWLWLTGAGLLAVVVAKMFLIDLSKTETIARVVSFIGVGILFLVVGYVSPIPPKSDNTEGTDAAK